MGQRHSEYDRAAHDWYCEPAEVVHGLFSHAAPFTGGRLHDPCVGSGTIVDVAWKRGYIASGADIVDRADGRFPVADFFTDTRVFANIVTNPPFDRAAELVRKALDANLCCGGRVAVLVPVNFLCSAKRFGLFNRAELDAVWVLSKRPSMPPGDVLAREGEACRHSGSIDFCWAIWQRGRGHVSPTVGWVPPNG